MNSRLSPEELESNLNYFTGTESYYRYNDNYVLTDGAKYLAENAGCFWLMDCIVSYKNEILTKFKRTIDFQVWKLKVKNNQAVLTLTFDEKVLINRKIEYTDFPLEEITLFVGLSHPNLFVIMLTSEY